jgi:hypothetical protein
MKKEFALDPRGPKRLRRKANAWTSCARRCWNAEPAQGLGSSFELQETKLGVLLGYGFGFRFGAEVGRVKKKVAP